MYEEFTIVEKWASSINVEIEKKLLLDQTQITLKNIQIYDRLTDIEENDEQTFLYRVYQIQYKDRLLDEVFMTMESAKGEMNRLVKETMKDDELYDYLEEMGYNIRFDDGEVNVVVTGEMAANEGVEYHETLERWLK